MGARVTRAQWNSQQVDKLYSWLAEEIHGHKGKIMSYSYDNQLYLCLIKYNLIRMGPWSTTDQKVKQILGVEEL